MKQAVKGKAPLKELQYLSDKTAMLDMAAAFGHGAHGVKGGRDITWNLDALLDGKHFVANRLAKKKCCYWNVRDEALRVARVVGRWAARGALEENRRNELGFIVIERSHMQNALGQLGPGGPGASREDCPF